MKHRDRNIDDPIQAEHDAMDEAESASPHEVDEAQVSDSMLLGIEAGSDTSQATPAELAAVHTDNESARQAEGPVGNGEERMAKRKETTRQKQRKSSAPSAAKSVAPKAPRSQRYLKAVAALGRNRFFEPVEAIRLAKESAAGSKFDAAIEVHVRLMSPKGGKGEGERYRTVISLPHGTGKEPKIVILDEALIDRIAKEGDTEYDVLLATPALMPKVAKIAKILGPKGKMPNPKTGTVTDNPEAVAAAIASGRIELRADETNNLHQVIGRASWPIEKLIENFQALRAALPAHRLRTITVCATFGPGIPIDLSA